MRGIIQIHWGGILQNEKEVTTSYYFIYITQGITITQGELF